eukprot:IDg23153t1
MLTIPSFRCKSEYCLQGRRVCAPMYAAIVGLCTKTVSKCAREAVASKAYIDPSPSGRKTNHRYKEYKKGILTVLVSGRNVQDYYPHVFSLRPYENVCDGCSGHIKRMLRRSNIRVPAEMLNLIARSAHNMHCVASVEFTAAKPGVVTVRTLSIATEWKSFNLLKNKYTRPESQGKEAGRNVTDFNFERWLTDEKLSSDHRTWRLLSALNMITWYNYLVTEIVERYFKEDPDLAK